MSDTISKSTLLEKLEQLKNMREKLIEQANQQLAHITGQIELITELVGSEVTEDGKE